jgi:Bax protein
MRRICEVPTIPTARRSERYGLRGWFLLLPAALLLAGFCGCGTHDREAEDESVLETEPGDVTAIPDFKAIRDVTERKKQFFEFMRPIIRSENAKIREKRRLMMDLYLEHLSGAALSLPDSTWLAQLAETYEIDLFDPCSESSWTALRRRVDSIPLALALVQAANESAWGTSRFAREGNGLFGQWCFGPARGMVPERRREGARHKVARFKSVNQSVRSYIHNLNTHPAYREMRSVRLEMRRSGQTPTAQALASGLVRYSERGEEYLAEILKMLQVNRRLMGLDRPDLPSFVSAENEREGE